MPSVDLAVTRSRRPSPFTSQGMALINTLLILIIMITIITQLIHIIIVKLIITEMQIILIDRPVVEPARVRLRALLFDYSI